jgi:hypothetical protein
MAAIGADHSRGKLAVRALKVPKREIFDGVFFA